MRAFKIAVCVVFVAVTALFSVLFIKDKLTADTSRPVITVDSELSEVSVKVTDEELLKGVTAYDEKDKDITDKIIVESISKFIEKGVCKVTYAVCDSDNHVATATKKIRYTDYTPPKFYMTVAPCFSTNETVNLSGKVGARDAIDGDISDNLVLTSQNFVQRTAGTYIVEATVTNSRGDTAELEIPVTVEHKALNAPVITLSDYIIYSDINRSVDFKSYIKSVSDRNGETPKDEPTVRTNADFSKPGVYTADFYVEDSDKTEGHTSMIIVVGYGE